MRELYESIRVGTEKFFGWRLVRSDMVYSDLVVKYNLFIRRVEARMRPNLETSPAANWAWRCMSSKCSTKLRLDAGARAFKAGGMFKGKGGADSCGEPCSESWPGSELSG
jgi:hypothetical protein